MVYSCKPVVRYHRMEIIWNHNDLLWGRWRVHTTIFKKSCPEYN